MLSYMSSGLDVADIRGNNVQGVLLQEVDTLSFKSCTDIGLNYSCESVYVCLSAVFARVL